MKAFRKKSRKEYVRIALNFPLHLEVLVSSKKWCTKAQQAVRACTKMLVETGVLSQDNQADVDLVNLHEILQSMSFKIPIDLDATVNKLGNMKCAKYGCRSCGPSLEAALDSTLNAVKVGRKGECQMCFQCFKEGRFALAVGCTHLI